MVVSGGKCWAVEASGGWQRPVGGRQSQMVGSGCELWAPEANGGFQRQVAGIGGEWLASEASGGFGDWWLLGGRAEW